MSHSSASPVEDSIPQGKDLKSRDEADLKEVPQHASEAVINDRHAGASKMGRHGPSRKAELSAYMAIAASAFGLISDGCKLQCQLFAQ